MSREERYHSLIMKAIDGELSKEEEEEFQMLLHNSEKFRTEWNSFKRLKEVTNSMRLPKPSEEVWDRYWTNVYYRLERGVAWILISLSAIVLLTFAGFQAIESLLADTELDLPLKIALLALIAGFAILIVSVIREKWFMAKTDKYKEVIR